MLRVVNYLWMENKLSLFLLLPLSNGLTLVGQYCNLNKKGREVPFVLLLRFFILFTFCTKSSCTSLKGRPVDVLK